MLEISKHDDAKDVRRQRFQVEEPTPLIPKQEYGYEEALETDTRMATWGHCEGRAACAHIY
jgi:hypothetical protein